MKPGPGEYISKIVLPEILKQGHFVEPTQFENLTRKFSRSHESQRKLPIANLAESTHKQINTLSFDKGTHKDEIKILLYIPSREKHVISHTSREDVLAFVGQCSLNFERQRVADRYTNINMLHQPPTHRPKSGPLHKVSNIRAMKCHYE